MRIIVKFLSEVLGREEHTRRMAYLSLGTFTQKGGHQFARELSADFSFGDWVQAIGMDATEANPKWWSRKQNPLNSIWFPAGQKHFPGD